MICENNTRRLHEFRPFGACPDAEATMEVVLRYKKSTRETTHYLCTTCSRAFTRHYGMKGHRIRQRPIGVVGRKSVWEVLVDICVNSHRREWREYMFGKAGPIMPRF